MFCGGCGREIKENALSCPYCNWVVSVMTNIDSTSRKVSAEKEILIISERVPELTLIQIVTNTNLEMDEAETAIKNLTAKGIANRSVDSSGQTIYTFNNEAFKKIKEKQKDEESSNTFWGIIAMGVIIFLIVQCIVG